MHTSESSWLVADEYLADLARVDVSAAEALGAAPDIAVEDVSPAGFQARNDAHAAALAKIDPGWDDPLAAALRERLTSEIALYESGFTTTLLAPLATPVHGIQQVFDQLPQGTMDEWARVARNLRSAARAFPAFRSTLHDAAQRGHRIAARQAEIVARQVETWLNPEGTNFFHALVSRYAGGGSLGRELMSAASAATRAAAEFSQFLRTELVPLASRVDAVGRDRYEVTSSAFLGARVDLAEMYEYGWSELRRLTAEAQALVTDLTGETHHDAGCAVLDRRPEYAVAVGEPLVDWLQRRLDEASAFLIDTHFDVPPSLRPVQARMATAESAVMYYSPPAADHSRPGRVWWSTSPGTTHVSTWREVSTVHHEGLPGHHLQHAISMGLEHLHPFQRYLCHVHGYAEGWAHYSEQLAVDLGMVRDGAERLGVLHAQRWRAARIVIDLGLHLELDIPAGNGLTEAERFTPDSGATFLAAMAGIDAHMARNEVDRYLGWPGQALAFKTGARLWEAVRSEQQRSAGSAFDLKEFHMSALRLGPMGLDPLRAQLAKARG